MALPATTIACAPRQNNYVNDLNKQALSGLVGFVLTMAFCIFLPVWTFAYWQAWLLLSVLFLSLLVIRLYLMKKEQRLLERRLRAETQNSQKIGQRFGSLAFVATLVLRFCCSLVFLDP